MSHDIVIVGAGAAGVAAARWLRSQGVDPLIVEARNRVGGRAWTDTTLLGAPIDMGGAWLHSAGNNPWTAYARGAGFEIIERLPSWQRRIGTEVVPPDVQRIRNEAFARNEQIIADAAAAGRDVSIAGLIPNDEFRPWFDAVMGFLMGVDSEQVSSLDYARYTDSELNWSLPRGLGTVVAHAAQTLDVQRSTAVRGIDYSGNVVKLSTDRGEIESRAVIVTVPTSVLATQTIRFTPALPATMHDAFAAVPLGADNKVFFRVAPGRMPFDGEGTQFFIGRIDSSRTGSYATRPADQQDLLLAFFGGGLAKELEERGELEHFARDELSKIFGADFSKHLQAAVSTAWCSDPWSRGSYSAALPGNAHMREVLQEPIAERIFFAGEACSIEYFGTVMGAWRSGVSAAERALTAIRKPTE
jgi:monoamine oxidase